MLAELGYTYGDLSAYNVLVDEDGPVLIDLPQAVDITRNPHGFDLIRRDCENLCAWFNAQGNSFSPASLERDLVQAFLR